MKYIIRILSISALTILVCSLFWTCSPPLTSYNLSVDNGSRIVLVGNNLCSRMLNFGDFETEMHLRFPDSKLFIRNICDGGNTAGFRQHAGRYSPWAYPGAQRFQTELAKNSDSQGHFPSPDQWLTDLKADVIIGFFGYNESFQGAEGLENFKDELDGYVKHVAEQSYNGQSAPQLILISPTAFEDLSDRFDLPNGVAENTNIAMYTEAMHDVAESNQVPFVNVYIPSKKWFEGAAQMTIDGVQLNDKAYDELGNFLVNSIYGKSNSSRHKPLINKMVKEKNWYWHNDFKMPNGVHVFGRRYNPFGPDNYPSEFKKLRELTAIRDSAIWLAAKGIEIDLKKEDQKTIEIPIVQSNFKPGDYGRGSGEYLYGADALKTMHVPEGYKIELFASEEQFPDLANPVQLSFDNKGRLWVSTMPTYPHWKPGDPKPNDKIIILEDTNSDGKADKQITFADGLHLPVGFEFAPEGVYLSQGTNFKLLKDVDGDDKADIEEIIFSGFDDHDTHHNISAFCADPSGAIYMAEGVFLHTSVETPYGPIRASNGGFYRFDPNRKYLERTAQLSIPNPWGIAFDEWGQNFFAETSGPAVRWMMPTTVKPRYGTSTHKSYDLIEDEHKVRPTSGLEFISSRHFPDEVQGDLLINNTIGFLGTKQHRLTDDTTGYVCKFQQDLLYSEDGNFRPVDLEFAPDGSLYIVDWHNVLVGHMQHNARDPYRDHVHGRIYRITYPSRPLVSPAKVYGASIEELLENLKLPEYRSRYRSRRELRGRNTQKVLDGLQVWLEGLDEGDSKYEHHLLEALWVTQGLNSVDQNLLQKLLKAKDFRVRAAAVRVLRYTGHQVSNQTELMVNAAEDGNNRVRLEAIVAASWLDKEDGLKITAKAKDHPLDRWMKYAHQTSDAHLNDREPEAAPIHYYRTRLRGEQAKQFFRGMEIYERDGYCSTCHQMHGQGLPAVGYPPIVATKWALGDQERLIKLVLKGIHGPIEIGGKSYPGTAPMTPYEGLLDDQGIADVLTFVRNTFGNEASAISPEKVKEVREKISNKSGFYTASELLSEHPF